MKRQIKTGRKMKLYVALIVVLLLVPSVSVSASVTAVSEEYAQAESVYVAGNPDCYPIEYYDTEKKCYRGVMPELLDEISRESGVKFVYIEAGSKDQRYRLAENRQVELLSGCLVEEDLPAQTGAPFLSVTIEDETYDVAFGYTEIASKELQTLVEAYVSDLSRGEMARRVTTFAAENERKPVSLGLWIFVCGMCVVFAAAALWAFLKIRRKTSENEVNQQIDPGTGVWNRQYFLRHFSMTVSDKTCSLYYMICLHFDIGRVNEYYGEKEAEELLQYAADTLMQRVFSPNCTARISGGGFVVLHQYASSQQAESWVLDILQELDSHNIKFGRDYRPKFHAGIYKLQPGVTCETAIYAADQGRRNAEQENCPYIFCDENLLYSRRESEKLRHEVIQAIENHEFKCRMQFIAYADTQEIYGAELLSRWHHPELGFLMPAKYISVMEESGTIAELDFYMFEEACRLLERLAREGWKDLHIFCNVSRKTVSQANFFERIKNIAQGYSFDYRQLCLEITESYMFESEDAVRECIRQCRQMGFCVALDDVGSGYSSFGDLVNYPVDLAKIDRSLLLGAEQEKGYRLLQGMNTLFHNIHIRTLCEGVETQEQCRMIRELGIDLIQGFFVQRALPIDEALGWLKEKREKAASIQIDIQEN